MRNTIKLFNSKKIRVEWDSDKEEWYFSIVDVIEILTESPRPRKYWNDLKQKLLEEGSQLSENIGQLKLLSSDGKKYNTDVADTEQLLRLIQSIPSKKAEPFKMWLAEVGRERIDETEDPETFNESKEIATEGGNTAKVAKDRIEKRLGRKVVTSKNAKEIHFEEKMNIE